MSLKNFTQEQKLTVLKSADKVGIKQAAQIAGVHYTTVYDWRNKLDSLGETNFLSYKPSYPGRGIKEISPEKEKAVLDCWKKQYRVWPRASQGPASSPRDYSIGPHHSENHEG